MKYDISNEQEMVEQGEKFASKLTSGMILCLHGDLGAGKTTFTKGLARGLGIENDIKSPTFALMNIYPVPKNKKLNFVHIDTYRLKSENELLEIGVLDYLGLPDYIVVIEWPEKIQNILKKLKVTDIFLGHSSNNKRTIEY